MVAITSRADKGSSLTHAEVDANFNNLNAALAVVYMPGEIRHYAGSAMPAHWLECLGQLLEVSDYPELFAAIGAQYGGNGTTSFALPNLRSVGNIKRIICAGAALVQPYLQINIPASIHGPLSGIYSPGDDLEFTVQLLSPIAVTYSSPVLVITIGTLVDTVTLASSTSLSWVFNAYTIPSGAVGDVSVSIDYNGAVLTSVDDTSPAVLDIVYTPSGINVSLKGHAQSSASVSGSIAQTLYVSGNAQSSGNVTGTGNVE